MFLLFKYAWDSFKQPFSPCFAYEKPVVSLIFLHSRSLKCVWCVRTSWKYHETDCEHNAWVLDISLMSVTPNTCRLWKVFVYSSLHVRNECVSIRILLLRTESMYFAYDCKLHLHYKPFLECTTFNRISIMHIFACIKNLSIYQNVLKQI